MEVLAGAVHAQLGVPLLVDGPVAAQLREVGEGAQEGHLVGDHRHALGPELLARGEVVGQHGVLVLRRHVVAEHDRGQGGTGPRRAHLGRLPVLRAGEVEGGAVLDRDGLLGAVLDRLQLDQGGPGLDLAAGDHQQLLDAGGERRVQHRLHLHRLQHQHRRARLHLRADGGGGGDDQRGRRRAEHPALVAADPVRHPVDLDQGAGAVDGGDEVVPAPADDEPCGGTRRSGRAPRRRSARCRRRRRSPGSARVRC